MHSVTPTCGRLPASASYSRTLWYPVPTSSRLPGAQLPLSALPALLGDGRKASAVFQGLSTRPTAGGTQKLMWRAYRSVQAERAEAAWSLLIHTCLRRHN